MKMKPETNKKRKTAPRPKQRRIHKSKTEKEEVIPLERLGLENLKPPKGARTKKKILGRGSGSGHGQTSTRGTKGQTSRAGRHFYAGFEGGQVPLIRKIPKRGFSNLKFKRRFQVVNIKDLLHIKANIIDPQFLEDRGLVESKDRLIKILGEGEISGPITVKAHAFSKAAKDKIEKSGGRIEIINA